MKKLTRIVAVLSFVSILSLGLTVPSQSEQATQILQASHGDTW